MTSRDNPRTELSGTHQTAKDAGFEHYPGETVLHHAPASAPTDYVVFELQGITSVNTPNTVTTTLFAEPDDTPIPGSEQAIVIPYAVTEHNSPATYTIEHYLDTQQLDPPKTNAIFSPSLRTFMYNVERDTEHTFTIDLTV